MAPHDPNNDTPMTSEGTKATENRSFRGCLYHLTHIENLDSIVKCGMLLSHTEARKGMLKRDAANKDVNEKRDQRDLYNRLPLHDYVPLYFNPKNPMLFSIYKKHHTSIEQDEMIIFIIDYDSLCEKDVIFTDGNATSNESNQYRRKADLSKLNWDCIYDPFWNNYKNGSRIRCAEMLVYPHIELSLIKSIICNNESIKTQIINVLNDKAIGIPVQIDQSCYFK